MKRVNNLPQLKHRRKELRKNSTPEENLLWSKLRRGQLGVKFKRQHSIGPYVLDFYCPEKLLSVELDGSIHSKSIEYDKERTFYLADFGIKELRFWNSEVNDNIGLVMERIKEVLDLRPAKGEVP